MCCIKGSGAAQANDLVRPQHCTGYPLYGVKYNNNLGFVC